MSKVSNVAETDPVEFAKILSEKLQRVLDEQNQREMVRSKLSAMSEVGDGWFRSSCYSVG